MKRLCGLLIVALAAAAARDAKAQAHQVELLCHRTANQDVPENTLESLEQATLLGCDVVELDVRRTLDGVVILNHDGFLERLTDGVGEVETTYYEDLRLRDVGGWMGQRFAGLRIVTFAEALRVAKQRGIRIAIDIKVRETGADVLKVVQQEGMLEHVEFDGEWEDVKALYPAAPNPGDLREWVQPGVSAEQVAKYHRAGRKVIVNFSATQHAMDLAAMKAAVTAGVDGINVDYPRLGADAVGRPVEARLKELAAQANAGSSSARSAAILQLAKYRGFPLQAEFADWLMDADAAVSRAAAFALVTGQPKVSAEMLAPALRSQHADVRGNAAWALGVLGAPARNVVPLLKDQDAGVLQEALIALAHMPGDVSERDLLPLLAHQDQRARSAAAVALARHQPEVAATAVPAQMWIELQKPRKIYEEYVRRGKTPLSDAEKLVIAESYRCQMKFVEAISMLKEPDAMRTLEELAFRPAGGLSEMSSVVAAFQLWDRIGVDARAAVTALASNDVGAADRAEWMLVQGGPAVLSDVRVALGSGNAAARERAIRIVAWQGDRDSLAILKSNTTDSAQAAWAIEKIESLHPRH